MHNQKLTYQKNLDHINCENKHTCFHIKNYGSLCPQSRSDIKNIGVYYAPTPKSMGQEDNKDDVFYLNNHIDAENPLCNKNIHISIDKEEGLWRVALIPNDTERKRLQCIEDNGGDDCLIKICRESKSILTKKKSALRICKSILSHQEKFFADGIEHIKPMSLLDVAFDVSLDESCVSRYSHKIIIHTPHGTIKLKYLFNSQGYMGNCYVSYSKISIQMKMKNIVEHEGDTKKISDNGMVNILKNDGIEISRRAVAKYRLEMGIPSSFERRRSCMS